jgi:hypothetical protein
MLRALHWGMSAAILVASPTSTLHYYVVTSRACMPGTCWGQYSYSAVVRVDGEPIAPATIRDTARVTVLCRTDPGFDGRSLRCAAVRNEERMLDTARRWARAWATAADERYADSMAEREGEEV